MRHHRYDMRTVAYIMREPIVHVKESNVQEIGPAQNAKSLPEFPRSSCPPTSGAASRRRGGAE
eukprot:3263833-Pyramimonas_sp.AAC.1